MTKLIDLKQDTQEWREYRQTRIGASDFALYMCHIGKSKPVFNIDFNRHIFEKRNNIFVTNPYMEMGKKLEKSLLERFNNEFELGCVDTIWAYNDNIFASLDGYDIFAHKGVELKTTSKDEAEFDNLVQYYYWQCQHQMLCADLKEICLYIYFIKTDTVKFINVSRETSTKKHLLYCEDYLNILNDNKQYQDIEDYKYLCEQIQELEKAKEKLQQQIFEEYSEGIYGNASIKSYTKNSTQYAKYIKDNNIIVPEQYVNTSEYKKITFLESK